MTVSITVKSLLVFHLASFVDGELWLYDGQLSAEMLEIGRVTFTLQSDASSQDTFITSAYSEKVYSQRRQGTLWRTWSSLFHGGKTSSDSDLRA